MQTIEIINIRVLLRSYNSLNSEEMHVSRVTVEFSPNIKSSRNANEKLLTVRQRNQNEQPLESGYITMCCDMVYWRATAHPHDMNINRLPNHITVKYI